MHNLKYFVSLVVLLLTVSPLLSQSVDEKSGSIVWDLAPTDPRITLRYGTKGINVGGYEDTAPVIMNNFGDVLLVKVEFTLTDFCGESRVFTVSKRIKGRETWAPNPFMEGNIFNTN